MISNEELMDILYTDILSECQTLKDEMKALKLLDDEHKDLLRRMYCNTVLYAISQGYTKYNSSDFNKNELIQVYLEIAQLLPEDYTYYHLIYYFFKQENEKCLLMLEEYIKAAYEESKEEIKKPDDFINEGVFVDQFFEPFKQAFEGFWSCLAKILRKYPTQKGIPELCEIVEQYYTCKTDNEILELLIDMMQKYPDLVLIRELVGYTYYSMKMWNNAIAYFESVEENGIFFTEADLYFMLAWSYGKIKNHKTEENYYRKATEIRPNNVNLLNNLGYSLYSQKKYKE